MRLTFFSLNTVIPQSTGIKINRADELCDVFKM